MRVKNSFSMAVPVGQRNVKRGDIDVCGARAERDMLKEALNTTPPLPPSPHNDGATTTTTTSQSTTSTAGAGRRGGSAGQAGSYGAPATGDWLGRRAKLGVNVTIQCFDARVATLAMHPAPAPLVFVGGVNGSLVAWKPHFEKGGAPTEKYTWVNMEVHTGPVSAIRVDGRGDVCLSASYDGTVRCLDLGSGVSSEAVTPAWLSGGCPWAALTSLAFMDSASGNLFAVSDKEGSVLGRDRRAPGFSFRGRPHKIKIFSIDASCDGRLLATASKDAMVRVFDMRSGGFDSPVMEYSHTRVAQCVSFSPASAGAMATSSSDNTVTIWRSVGQRTEQPIVTEHANHAYSTITPFNISFDPSGKHVAIGGMHRTLDILSASTGATVAVVDREKGVSAIPAVHSWHPRGMPYIAFGTGCGAASLISHEQ
jgi:WD40 repeat protein